MATELAWLNSWQRVGPGAAETASRTEGFVRICCVGCGRSHGMRGAAGGELWPPPGSDPVWPFAEGECPVCRDRRRVFDVAASEIQPGQEWLLCGKWVRVVHVLARGEAERVSVTYEQDGEQATIREYRGFERAAVR